MRSLAVIVSVAGLALASLYVCSMTTSESHSSIASSLDTAGATRLLNRQPGFFVPNLGQWDHPAKFVHRSGSMTLFLEDRGWVLDLVDRPIESHATTDDGDVERKTRAVALKMTFEGDEHVPEIVGENRFAGHHNYFLGDDESRWRDGVPLYGSVRYENLYPGIDVRLRETNGVPEYDLLLQPGADLSLVIVHVEGGQGLSIVGDGSLLIETALGPVTQPSPKTWVVDSAGEKHELVCKFTLLDGDRFGFTAPDWDGHTSLTVDPGLIWSTFLGGASVDLVTALSVDAGGVVTVTGYTGNTTGKAYPTTSGAYRTTYYGGNHDVFVSRLDPNQSGAAQLVYSTFLGGRSDDFAYALAVSGSGVVTLAGSTRSSNFPTVGSPYDASYNAGIAPGDAFVSRLDPSKTGSGQLVYSTFLGGDGGDQARALSVDGSGVVTVAGFTGPTTRNGPNPFPATTGAYSTAFNGGATDVFVSRLDPSNTGRSQLLYSTFLGHTGNERAFALTVDANGVATLSGESSSAMFPTTGGAYDTLYNGGSSDAFVSRLDPSKTGTAQLVYSTFLGGTANDLAYALSVDAGGVMTVAGWTGSANFPPTGGAYSTTKTGALDAFVSRLDPSKTGTAQLVYSTFLGGAVNDLAYALSVDAGGVVTVAGYTGNSLATQFPTTSGAYHSTFNGGFTDAFVSRLDPSKTGSAQLVYSTYFGGKVADYAYAMSVDPSGVVTVAGFTTSDPFPLTSGAYQTTNNSGGDAFVSRLSMGVALYADVHAIPIKAGGSQKFTVNAGKANANKSYWIFGSATGTKGFNLLGIHIPLDPDVYTDISSGLVNSAVFKDFRGTLSATGTATASLNVPGNQPIPTGFTLYHAYIVYDASGLFYMASNPVPVQFR